MYMKNKFLYFSFFLFVFGMVGFVHAETINGTAVATIKRSTYISQTQDVNADIIVRKKEMKSLRNKRGKGKTVSNKVRTNHFKVKGVPFSAVDISLEATRKNTKNQIVALSNFVHDAGKSPQFNSAGALDFNVEGVLEINEQASQSEFAGNYEITLNLQ